MDNASLDRSTKMSQKPLRALGRAADEMRPLRFTRHYTRHAEGSALVELGETWVLCTASLEAKVPNFLRGTNRGWLTAEYSMLPRATTRRNQRGNSSRSIEIQRLIGRSLRSAVNLDALKGHTVLIDCDVLQADGGTRTAAINGAYLALHDAMNKVVRERVIEENPLHGSVAAVSVGICSAQFLLDLDYQEDSSAEADINVVMNDIGHFIELQGTAEGHAFRRQELDVLLDWAERGIRDITNKQRKALGS